MSEPRFNRLDPDTRREGILDAAIGLYAERGVEGVGMADVARAAGVTRGLVNHYFGGKAGLTREVARTLAARGPAQVRTDLDLPLEEVVARNVEAWLDHFEAEVGALAALDWPTGGDAELRAIVEAGREAVVERMLVNHLGTTDVPDGARLLLRAYAGMSLTACREWLVQGRASRAQVHALMTDGLLALMRDALPAVLAAEPARPPAAATS